MSLTTPLSVALPAVHLLYARNNINNTETAIPQTFCAHRDPETMNSTYGENYPLPVCQPIAAALDNCIKSAVTLNDPVACEEFCGMVNSGFLVERYMECFKEGCTDWEEHQEHNKLAIETIAKDFKEEEGCERMAEEKKGNGTKPTPPAEEEEEDSSARGLGVKGGVVVMAVVFGAVFLGVVG
ncbi:hypothetical protein BJ508DRAFT_416932 [Ascobolus immersus RN42]|uniref:Uncharacterized protein n=1 Tax=Ascobolus immersus RN42 TaxID=1160509 RepID=A0A3N4HV08_ASCIM|nr:hypothetical protein BJ508DRAFT_416932 [Ascobolus immersus RN42]